MTMSIKTDAKITQSTNQQQKNETGHQQKADLSKIEKSLAKAAQSVDTDPEKQKLQDELTAGIHGMGQLRERAITLEQQGKHQEAAAIRARLAQETVIEKEKPKTEKA